MFNSIKIENRPLLHRHAQPELKTYQTTLGQKIQFLKFVLI